MRDSLPTRVIAIMIGRGGSSMKGKNTVGVLGHPILHWGAAAAKASRIVLEHYISSDSDEILALGAQAGYTPIKRPSELATAEARGIDAVQHAMSMLPLPLRESDIVLVQHANCATISAEVIDRCLVELLEDSELTAVIPGHLDNDHHPFRAKRLMPDGTVESFFKDLGKLSSNRQELPECVFFDHSVWAIRVSSISRKDGEAPWPEMGKKVRVVKTSGAFDIHTPEDVALTENWLIENKIPKPDFR